MNIITNYNLMTQKYLCKNRNQHEYNSQTSENINFKATVPFISRKVIGVIGSKDMPIYSSILVFRTPIEQKLMNKPVLDAPLITNEKFERIFAEKLNPYKEKYSNAKNGFFADKLWAVYADKGPLAAMRVFKIFEQIMATKKDDGSNLYSPSEAVDVAGINTKEYPVLKEFEEMLEPYKEKYIYFEEKGRFADNLVQIYKDKGPIYAMRVFRIFEDIMNLKDDTGMNRCYEPKVAVQIAKGAVQSPKAYETLIGMKDSFGNPRYELRYDSGYEIIDAIENISKNPELFLKYAQLNDINGHPRFSLESINNLILLNNEFDVEDIDNALNLTNDDGSYVFEPGIDSSAVIKQVKENPETLKNKNRPSFGPSVAEELEYWHSKGRITEALWAKYQQRPEAITLLFGIPSRAYFGNRFKPMDIKDVDNTVLDYIEKYPKSFMALANIRYNYEDAPHRFSFDEICDFINNFGIDKKDGSCHEIPPEIMNYIGLVSLIESLFNTRLSADQIIKSYEAYKKYPDETFKILSGYKVGKGINESFICPKVEDVELYIKDKAAFEAKFNAVKIS